MDPKAKVSMETIEEELIRRSVDFMDRAVKTGKRRASPGWVKIAIAQGGVRPRCGASTLPVRAFGRSTRSVLNLKE
jgi:hypothetical protein